MNKHHLFLLLLGLVAMASCRSQNALHDTNLNVNYRFLEQEEGKAQITTDQVDFFFDKIGSLDMRLQMKEFQDCHLQNSCLEDYKQYLRNSVLPFSVKEKEVLTSVLDSCFSLIKGIAPNLEIPKIELIKIDIDHYGASVYYTRENAILIPVNESEKGTISSLLPVMLHEISHILLRYNQKIKDEAYALIGFNKLDKPVAYSDQVLTRILHNPDGLDNRYFIDISIDDQQFKAIPLLISTKSKPNIKISGFMNYVKFDLFEVEEKADHFFVRSTQNGYTTLPSDGMKSFFSQIKENTQYVIHPDEIIADNFMMLILTTRDGTVDNFNEEGQKLLMDLKLVLNN